MAEYRVCTSCERRESEMRSLRSEVERLGRERDEALNQFHLAEEWRRKLKDELAAAREALEKADALFDRTLSASNDASFDQYLHGDAEDVWVSICEAAEQYDEARAAAKGGEGNGDGE